MRRAKRFIIIMATLAGLFGVGAAALTGFLLAHNLGEELNPITMSRLHSPLLFYGIPFIWAALVCMVWLLPGVPDITKIVMATAALAAAAIDFSLNVAVIAYPALEHWLGIVGIRISITSVPWNYVALPVVVCLSTFLIVLASFTAEEDDSPPASSKPELGIGRP